MELSESAYFNKLSSRISNVYWLENYNSVVTSSSKSRMILLSVVRLVELCKYFLQEV